MATNEILQFAETDTGTNLLTQGEYAADSQRPIGNQPGVARSKLVNKALRQASLIAAGLAEYIADNQANNVTDALTPQNIADYLQAAITGALGVTPPQFDNDTSLATTAFVQRALGNMRGYRYVTASGNINQNDLGSFLYCAPSSPVSLAVINSGVVSAGAKITIGVADYAGIQPVTLTLATGLFVFFNQITSSSLTLQRGQQIELVGDAGGNWIVVNGSGSANLAASGYQKLPSGIIFQWYNTNVTIPANSSLAITLPIAFPSTHAACVATARNGLSPNSGLFSVVNTSATQATVHNNGSAVSNGVYLFAIGY